MNKSKTRKTNLHLVFDEVKRREFLTGFRKRKLQRKQAAKDQLEKELKNERKRLKLEAKESYKKLVKSFATIPEVEDLLEEEYEDDNVNVKVVELSTCDIAKENNWIGVNQPKYEEESIKSESESETEDVPGMEIHKSKVKTEKEVKKIEPKPIGNIKKLLKKQATKNVQKSKVFQQKHKIERLKQKKKSMKKKMLDAKMQQKRLKNRKK